MSDILLYTAWGVAALVTWRMWGLRRLKIITVMDGDTFMGMDAKGKKYKLRLSGCDCPEIGQPLADEATKAVRDWIQGEWVVVRLSGRDKYQRYVASVTLPDGRDLARALLKAGLAYPLPGTWGLSSMPARLARRGLWGRWRKVMPWESPSRRKGAVGWLFRS